MRDNLVGVSTHTQPSHPVLAMFGLDGEKLTPVDDGRGWRTGSIVLYPVTDVSEVSWAGQALASIELPSVTIERPLRSRDGRLAVGGWAVYRSPEATGAALDVERTIKLSTQLHAATKHLQRPDFLDRRTDPLARADRMAWGELDGDQLDEARGGRWFAVLAGSCTPVELPDQIIHAELYGNVRPGADGLVVSGFRPFFRPTEWATALIVVDAIVAGDGGEELLAEWSGTPFWRQLLLRAMLFRFAAHALNPDAGEDDLERLRNTAGIVTAFR